MSELSNYLANELVDHVFQGFSYSSPSSNLYLALFGTVSDSDLNQSDFGEEISEPSYDRVSFSCVDGSTNQVENGGDITFNQATTNWGDVTAIAVCDGPDSTDNILCWDRDVQNANIDTDDIYQIPANNLTIDFSVGFLTDTIEEALVEHVFLGNNYTAPSSWDVALFTSTSNLESGSTANEVSENWYGRQTVTFSSTGTTSVDNDSDIEWNQASSGSVTIEAVATMDGGGQMLGYDDTVTHITIESGDTYRIPQGELQYTLE